MPNFLNLKKKDPSDIVYVEKIILKNRSLSVELFRMLTIIAVASGIVWGISNADNLVNSVETKSEVKNFSAIGTILNISDSSFSIDDAKGSNDSSQTSYTFNIDTVSTVETQKHVVLSLADLNVGDNIIVQGVEDSGSIFARRIISLSATTSKIIVDVATTTATTTDEIVASTTASSTASTTDSSTTPSLLENIGNTVGGVIDTIKDATQNIIDTITGTSTATQTTFDSQNSTGQASTDEVSSSTLEVIASSTINETPVVVPATDTPQVISPTPDPVVVPPTVDTPVVDAPAPTSEAPPAN